MSYILDALRRADAERERDPARGIHAQPAVAAVHAPQRAPAWLWAGGAATLALVAAWMLWGRGAPAPQPPVAVVAQQPAAVTAPVVVPVATAVSPPPPAPAPVVVERVAAKPAAPAVIPVAVPVAVPAAVAPAGAASAPSPAPVAATPAPERVLALAELPADVQRELPKLSISGGVHSENAAQRMLVVGGQVMGEGAELAPGLVLEQIRARTAVLRFRGYRYSVAY